MSDLLRRRRFGARHRTFVALLATLALVGAAPAVRADEGAATITADNVVKTAIDQNPTLAAAIADVRRADLLETGEEHRYGLVLQLDGSATQSTTPNAAFSSSSLTFPESTNYTLGGQLKKHLVWGTDVTLRVEGSQQRSVSTFTNVASNPPTTTQLSVGPNWGGLVRLSVTQPLLRGAGRDVAEAQLDVARVGRASAQSARDRTASQLLADALGAYWELYYASRALDIQRKSLELARQQRDETAARVRTGALAPVEQLSFETRIATIEEDVAKADAEERDRSTALARLLGDESLTQRRADTARPLPASHLPTGDLRSLALTASYDVIEQEQAVRLAEVQSKTAADSLRPRLDVEGYLQAQGLGARDVSPALDQIGTLRAVSAHVGVTYELPLDNTQRRAEKDRADLAIDAAKRRLDATKQKVTADLDTAVRKDDTARRRIELAEQSLAIAKKQLDAETARFRTGSSTALQVREAEDQVRSAELRAVRAEVDLAVAHQQIAHLTGRLLAERAR